MMIPQLFLFWGKVIDRLETEIMGFNIQDEKELGTLGKSRHHVSEWYQFYKELDLEK